MRRVAPYEPSSRLFRAVAFTRPPPPNLPSLKPTHEKTNSAAAESYLIEMVKSKLHLLLGVQDSLGILVMVAAVVVRGERKSQKSQIHESIDNNLGKSRKLVVTI